MGSLKSYWDKDHQRIPTDKDATNYAVTLEKDFPRQAFICDLGGGTGADSKYFLEQGHNVTLVDISDFALEVANNKIKDLKYLGSFKSVQCDLSLGNLPLESDSFDIVFSHVALHYFDSETMVKLWKEIERVLKQGGTAFVAVKSPEDPEEIKYLTKEFTQIEPGVFVQGERIKTRFSHEQFAQQLHKAGIKNFTVSEVVEDLVKDRKDVVKSGLNSFNLTQIEISKTN